MGDSRNRFHRGGHHRRLSNIKETGLREIQQVERTGKLAGLPHTAVLVIYCTRTSSQGNWSRVETSLGFTF